MTQEKALKELRRIALAASAGKSESPPKRIPLPEVPENGQLNRGDRWKSLLWAIDTAQTLGDDSLRGLTIALSRVIQGQMLEALIFDVRWSIKSPLDPDEPLWDRKLPLNAEGLSMDDLMVKCERSIKVELADSAVFPYPWERWRMHRALGRIGSGRRDGVWQQSLNHYGVGWEPWPIVLLSQGNHSTLAAQLRGGGTLTCNESYDFSPVLRAVRTDGEHWFRVDDGQILGPVNSIPMAGIFVIGQRLSGV